MSLLAGGSSDHPPDERAFRDHVALGDFRAAEDRGDWRLLSINWPTVLVAIAAAPRTSGPTHFVLKIHSSGYPATGLTAAPWDLARNALLAADLRPKGEGVGKVFRSDWQPALYAPFDRVAIADHQNWRAEHPRYVWDSTKTITWYLRQVWELLNDDDYQGV